MRKIYLIVLALSIIGIHENKAQDNSELYNHYMSIYQKGIKYNDYNIAKESLYGLLVIKPENDSLLYTLAFLYYDAQKYASSILVCMDLIKLQPNNLGAIEIMAISYENLGLKEKSLESYEKLYLKNTDNTNALYKMAFLQFNLNRFEECKTNIEILLQKKQIDEIKLVFSFEQDKQKEFPMRISILHLKGLLQEQTGDIQGAKKSYEEALALAPDFKYAKDNLDAINE